MAKGKNTGDSGQGQSGKVPADRPETTAPHHSPDPAALRGTPGTDPAARGDATGATDAGAGVDVRTLPEPAAGNPTADPDEFGRGLIPSEGDGTENPAEPLGGIFETVDSVIEYVNSKNVREARRKFADFMRRAAELVDVEEEATDDATALRSSREQLPDTDLDRAVKRVTIVRGQVAGWPQHEPAPLAGTADAGVKSDAPRFNVVNALAILDAVLRIMEVIRNRRPITT